MGDRDVYFFRSDPFQLALIIASNIFDGEKDLFLLPIQTTNLFDTSPSVKWGSC